MKRRFTIPMMIAGAMMGLGALSGCSFFAGDEGPLTIAKVEATPNEDTGEVAIVITYANEEEEPVKFTIPAARGVINVEWEFTAEDPGYLHITIYYNKGEPDVLRIPARSLNRIEVRDTYTGPEEMPDDGKSHQYVYAVYSDGTEEYLGELLQGEPGNDGEDGKDGTGIKNVTYETNEDGSLTVTISFTDARDDVVFDVPPGLGVTEVTYELDGDGNPTLVVKYSNGKSEKIVTTRGAGWFTGDSTPDDNGKYVLGDFYYCSSNATIYRYDGTVWRALLDFGELYNDTYTVTFYLNDEEETPAQWADGSTNDYITMDIGRGNCFASEGLEIPVPMREYTDSEDSSKSYKYEFAGWYAKRIPDINSGALTDLYTFWSSMTFFAHWVEA